MMARSISAWLCVTLLGLVPISAFASDIDFVHQIAPILEKRCGKCHLGEHRKGGLSMNSHTNLLAGSEFGPIVEPGNAAESPLIRLLLSEDELDRMPPQGERVPPDEIELLREWIDRGLAWEPGFTFHRPATRAPLEPRRVELPPATADREHPIDRLLDAYLRESERPLPPPLDDATFLRRVHLDTVGLLPTRAETKAFLADPAPDRRERKIAALLADDIDYADHWLTFWNDLLRNDTSGTGYITGGRRDITAWLYESLRSNRPYDEFVRALIAPTPASDGFIRGIRWRGDVNASQTVEIQFAQNISQVFLGLNMKCASCHDSFVDDWKLADAYGLAAVISPEPLELHRCDVPTGRFAEPRWIFPTLGTIDPDAPPEARLEQLAALMTHERNGRFTRTIVNRIWHRLMGRGIVDPVDAMDTPPWSADFLDFLAVRFAEQGTDLRQLIGFILTSQAYQSRSVFGRAPPGDRSGYRGPIARRMTAEQFLDAVWQLTGASPATMAASVDRREDRDDPPGPREITARWIWSEAAATRTPGGETIRLRRRFERSEPPNAAFVVVTCDNEYTLFVNGHEVGADPDWPSVERYDIAEWVTAGENVIEVEARNAGTAPNPAGLLLEAHFEGPGPESILATDASWEARREGGTWTAAAPVDDQHFLGGRVDAPFLAQLRGEDRSGAHRGDRPIRASLVENDFLMRSLGRPPRDQVVTTRPTELTTLQAIDLANGSQLAGYLRIGAERIIEDARPRDVVIEELFTAALSRGPTVDERAVLDSILGNTWSRTVVEDLLWTVVLLPEFQIVR